MKYDYDFIIIGSGFGGSVAAHRLTEKGYRVAVMEMGRRWTPENLPKNNWDLRNWIWRPGLKMHGFFNITPFRHVMILHGCAVGGGSVTYASTTLAPKETVWDAGSWAGLADWKREMPAFFEEARRMRGVTGNRILGPADRLLQKAAEAAGVGHTFYRTSVAIFQGEPGDPGGRTYPDPYFNGEGPERTSCNACGGCMMGCRHGAKNSLDKNYLYFAGKHGCRIYSETKVVDVAPLNGKEDGSDGYRVRAVKSTALFRKEPRTWTARGIVFAASALGTMDLMFRLKQRGSLPRLSDALGTRVRTNAESLIGVRVPRTKDDLSKGVAIGSGIYLDEHTHIEATRYPAESDSMGLLATVMARGSGIRRIAFWFLGLIGSLLRRPWRTLRALHPFGFARESMILLCMQTLEGHIDMQLGRPWYWPFRKVLLSRGQRIPANIPQANDFAQKLAEVSGGTAMSMLNEILFDIPGTAHIMGGCPMGRSEADGVVDHACRVFRYRNMYACDGSVLSANLGVNPSLTITALSERAMSLVPAAGEGESGATARI